MEFFNLIGAIFILAKFQDGVGVTITFVQNVHNSKLISSISCFLPADIIRVTQEFVTPRYLATSAPEEPNSLTPIHDIARLAFATALLRPSDRSSPIETLYLSDTFSASALRSIRCPDSLKFFLTRSSRPDMLCDFATGSFQKHDIIIDANTLIWVFFQSRYALLPFFKALRIDRTMFYNGGCCHYSTTSFFMISRSRTTPRRRFFSLASFTSKPANCSQVRGTFIL